LETGEHIDVVIDEGERDKPILIVDGKCEIDLEPFQVHSPETECKKPYLETEENKEGRLEVISDVMLLCKANNP